MGFESAPFLVGEVGLPEGSIFHRNRSDCRIAGISLDRNTRRNTIIYTTCGDVAQHEEFYFSFCVPCWYPKRWHVPVPNILTASRTTVVLRAMPVISSCCPAYLPWFWRRLSQRQIPMRRTNRAVPFPNR